MNKYISTFLIDTPRHCNMADRVFVQVLVDEILKVGTFNGEQGVLVQIDDGEEFVFDKPTGDRLKILDNLTSTGEDVIHVYDKFSGDKLAWFHLIYDNGSDHDPEVCCSDHSTSHFAEKVMMYVGSRMPCHPHKQEAF